MFGDLEPPTSYDVAPMIVRLGSPREGLSFMQGEVRWRADVQVHYDDSVARSFPKVF